MTAADQPVPPASLLGALLHDADGVVEPGLKSKAARTLARLGWSRTSPAERLARSAPGRDAAWQKWLDLVDPQQQFSTEVRDQMAREARRAHMSALAIARHHRPKAAPLVVRAEDVALFRDSEADAAPHPDDPTEVAASAKR